jgi:DNA polymerase I-like protein with 3'-5' exonuclease and polymerase domains
MRAVPTSHEGYQLLHDGAAALTQVEHNGIRIDIGYVKNMRKILRGKTAALKRELMDTKEWKIWRRRFGQDADLGKPKQLGDVIFKQLGFEAESFTKDGSPKTDEHALERTKLPFVQKYLRWKKYGNAENNFLAGIERETCDGFLHPFFNLNTVISFRSSSDSPNFQNYPARDPEISAMIRRAFIPRKGCVLVENDFKGVEVGVSACYNKDSNLIAYVKNPNLDMHRDMAMELFFLKKHQVSKPIRHESKNNFVFPQFYGDWFKSIADTLWWQIDLRKLLGPDGKSLYLHLAKHGITECGECDYDSDDEPAENTFEYHVMKTERKLWRKMFPEYSQWKKDYFEAYLKKGFFDSYTGFRYEGIFERNQVVNFPIQGSAFHCLLWSLIQNQKELKRKRAERLIIGQIHDSMISDVPVRELDDHNGLIKEIIESRLPKHWKWIIVPLKVETELVAPGMTWADKKGLDIDMSGDTRRFLLDGKPFVTRKALFNAMKANQKN